MSFGPFLIDCDTGRDDALTFWLAQRLGLSLVAVVASYGNVAREQVEDNTARVLSLMGLDDVPLLRGASEPIRLHRLYEPVVLARHKASGNGLCDVLLPESRRVPLPFSSPHESAAFISALADKHGPLEYVIIGPATNFSLFAKAWGPQTRQIISRVTMMGGKLGAFWDQDPTPDFNVACDPFAVDGLVQSGVPVRFLPLNATWPINISLEDIERLRPGTPVAEKTKEVMEAYCKRFAPEPIFRFHDPSVLLAALNPDSFKPSQVVVDCDEDSPSFGRLVETPKGHAVEIYETNAALQKKFKDAILRGLGFLAA